MCRYSLLTERGLLSFLFKIAMLACVCVCAGACYQFVQCRHIRPTERGSAREDNVGEIERKRRENNNHIREEGRSSGEDTIKGRSTNTASKMLCRLL